MSFVSVIVPCYSAENYIEKCLVSIANQTFRDFDVIFIDDCSPDNTIAKIDKLVEKTKLNAKVIKNSENLGPSLSRKKGVDLSEAEYVTFCDSDDWYEADYLELMVESCKNATKDIVFCNYKTVYSNGKITKHEVVQPLIKLEKKEIIGRSHNSLWSMMIRRSIIQSITFPNIRNGEDMAIIPVIIANSNSFGFVDKCIYNYFYHVGSLSKTYTSTMLESLRISFEYIVTNIGEMYPEETELLGMRNYLYSSMLNLFKATFDTKRARDILNGFEKDYPTWWKNLLLQTLPSHKRLYLLMVKHRFFLPCLIMSQVHKAISK